MAKRVSDTIHAERLQGDFALCRERLRVRVREARDKISDARQKVEFSQIAKRIEGDKWVTVAPFSRSTAIGAIRTGLSSEVKFNPAVWPSDIDPNGIHRALTTCRTAFRILIEFYERLTPRERAEFFPDGKPKP